MRKVQCKGSKEGKSNICGGKSCRDSARNICIVCLTGSRKRTSAIHPFISPAGRAAEVCWSLSQRSVSIRKKRLNFVYHYRSSPKKKPQKNKFNTIFLSWLMTHFLLNAGILHCAITQQDLLSKNLTLAIKKKILTTAFARVEI